MKTNGKNCGRKKRERERETSHGHDGRKKCFKKSFITAVTVVVV